MGTKTLANLYSQLSAEERFRLIVAASDRGDEAERERLSNASKRITYSNMDYSPYAQALQELALMALLSLVEEAAAGLDRANERIATTSTVVATCGGPRGYVGQRSRVPPERHAPRALAFRRRCAQAQVRSGRVEHHVIKLQPGDL